MLAYTVVYILGIVCGVGANVLLDVQLRKPALGRQIMLGVLGALVAIILLRTQEGLPEWLLLGLWAATGLLAGLGSRESRAPLT
jgi:hypothetical protein